MRPGITKSVTEVRQLSRLHRPVSVLVSGLEGAGKTRLVSAWADRTREHPAVTEISPRTQRHDFAVRTAREHWWQLRAPRTLVSMTVPPGQLDNEDRKTVFRDVDDPDLCPDGAIHVVCWGYNESWPGHDAALRKARKQSAAAAARPGTPPLSTADALLRINRDNELKDFRRVYPALINSWSRRARGGRRFWLVVALAKCDHYWPAVADAMRYYDPRGGSEFGTMLAELVAKVPRLRVEIRPVSTGLDPWGGFGLGTEHESAMTPDESLFVRNEFWTTVEALCGDR